MVLGPITTALATRAAARALRPEPDGVEKQNIASHTAPDKAKEDAQDKQPVAAARYQYPLKLSPTHPGRLVFRSYEIKGFDVAGEIGEFFDNLLGSRNSFKNDRDEDQSTATEDLTTEQQSQLRKFKTEAAGASYENLQGGTLQGTVTLPMMTNITFNDNAQYQTADLGIIGAGGEALAGGDALSIDGKVGSAAAAIAAQKAAALTGAGIGALAGTLAGAATKGGKLAGAGLGTIAGSNLLDGLEPAVQSATRVAVAPNERQLFRRMSLRKFAFTFKLIATSEKEALMIKEIIKFFRKEMYPEKVAFSQGGAPFAFKYPNVFDIEMKTRSGKDAAFRIQRCYLENCTTTFGGTAPSFYKGEYFVESDISLTFTETSVLDKGQIDKEGY